MAPFGQRFATKHWNGLAIFGGKDLFKSEAVDAVAPVGSRIETDALQNQPRSPLQSSTWEIKSGVCRAGFEMS